MNSPALEYVAASSADEVTAALADGVTAVLAGGQSLVPELADRHSPARRVVDINRVPGFDTLTESAGVLTVGPLVRHRVLETGAVGGPLGRLMRSIVQQMGHPPVRARGTVLGSLAHAHPAAEWPVVAVMLDAELLLIDSQGSRTVPAAAFFTGPMSTIRRPAELLAEMRLPVLGDRTGVGYAEGRRATRSYADAGAIAAVTVTDGTVTTAAIGLINGGPCPVRVYEAEHVLIGTSFSDAAIVIAARIAADADARDRRQPPAEARRRHDVVRTLTRRSLTQARGGAAR
ncbi:FAD binding domain-containing protein [Actinoplanes sp. G11-F43]|uniref:FAD binding domain-containing protein n=1 Tax=Actinoplanes sp. G11-F43 TaxID=3424130 RepID=UPI003D32D6D0